LKPFYTIILVLALVLPVLTACGSQPEAAPADLAPVHFYLSFVPNVQFAPFYVGIEKGFFAGQGLAVNIDHKPESESIKLVATDTETASVAVVSGEQVLLAREQEIPVVYVFEWYEQFPVAIASKAGLGLTAVGDLAGHSVGTPLQEGASYIGLEALLFSAGLSDADIDLQVTGFTQVETLLTDRVDAVVVYIANEPIQLEAQGEVINLVRVSDHADLVSNGLVLSEALVEGQPERVRQIVAAFDQALRYTIEHPDEAFEIATGYVEGLDDPAIAATQQEVLARSIELWQAERLGESRLAAWESMQAVLLEMGLLANPLDLAAAFTNDFLP